MKGYKSWLLTVSLCASLAAQAAEPESYASVRLADIDWTDIIVTIAVARQVLGSSGYKIKVNLLSVPVIYRSLANNDLDVLPDNWMSTVTNDIKQYAERGTVKTLHANLEGAKYTPAVPRYVYDGGLCSLVDIAEFSDKLDNKIYGIEPDNDSNRVVQSMIDKNAFELGKFKLAESDEAGMLSQVQRAIRRSQWVVFLGWESHPMNTRSQMEYLEGSDDFFGPNYGGATIYVNVRKGYAREYANVGQLLKNLSFTLEMENKLMDAILNEDKKPKEAAKTWLKGHPEQLDAWLAGVITRDRQPVAAATKLAFAKQTVDRSFPALDGP